MTISASIVFKAIVLSFVVVGFGCASGPMSSAEVERDKGRRIDAIATMSDQNRLATEAISNYAEVRRAAVVKINDPVLLANIAVHCPVAPDVEHQGEENDTRLWAIARLQDELLLAKIAIHANPLGSAQVAAVQKITAQSVLAHVAIESTGQTAATRVVIKRLSDTAWIIKVAKEAKSAAVGSDAIARIKDQGALFEIAISGNPTAAAQLQDSALLAKVVTQSRTLGNRLAAFKVLRKENVSQYSTRAEALRTIITESHDNVVRLAASICLEGSWKTVFQKEKIDLQGVTAASEFSHAFDLSGASGGLFQGLIRWGEEKNLPMMHAYLDSSYADKTLAESFLNSGRQDLENHANSWAQMHGYRLVPTQSGSYARWGSG
jgi:hypothetical protein